MDLARGQITIVINDSYQLAPWATYHYFCDPKWWKWHKDREDYKGFTGIRICQDVIDEPGIVKIDGESKEGLSLDPDKIYFNSNSGFQALNLAYHFGASRILLLGYDLKFAKDGRSHWFGDHPDNVRSNYPAWFTGFSIAADQLKEKGVEVVNCSPDTALSCFERMSLASALSSEQGQVLQQNRSQSQSGSRRSA